MADATSSRWGVPPERANTPIPLLKHSDEIHESHSTPGVVHYSHLPTSKASDRALWTNPLPILSRFFSFSVFAAHIPLVSAADAGDDFMNNLFSDLAPLLALFGDQVAKQYMSQSMSWVEDVIFAVAPLGIITAITGAIRVGGPPWMKAVIGRAREGKGVVEVELMSSTSTDVCELWNGNGVARVLGSTVESTPILELFYLEPTDNRATDRTVREPLLRDPTCWKSDPTGVYDFESAKSANILSVTQCPNRSTEVVENGYSNSGAPNISLNLGGQRVCGLELRGVAIIGIMLQLGVILFAGFSVLSSPWNERFKKNNKEVESRAFPLMAVGTVLLVLGMFLCSQIIERSTSEEAWIVKEPEAGFRANVAWLQRGCVVNDQQFNSYFIQPSDRASKFCSNKVWEKLLVACPDLCHTLQQLLNMDNQLQIRTSRKALNLLQQHIRTFIATSLSIFGFIGQFIGLRGLNWSVVVAQLVATAIMIFLRAVVRRNLVHMVEPERIDNGYELDWISRRLNHCSQWGVVIWGINSRSIRRSEGLATKVMDARCRLGALSKWECQWQKTVDSTAEAIESIMNFLCTSPDVTISSLSEVFEWGLVVEVAAGELGITEALHEVPGDPKSFEIVKLSMSRKWLPEGRGWSDWKVDKSKVEAVLGLWMLHNNTKDEQILPEAGILRVLDIEASIYERWIRRQTEPIKISSSGQTLSGETLRILGKPSISQSPPELLAIISKASLESICGQSILSAFISDFAESPSISIRGGARVRGGERGVKASFGWRNNVLDELADKVERTGLATAEDAFLSIVPPLGKAGKLPSNLGTSEIYSDIAKEIKTYLEGGRYEHAEPLFLWLIDTVETSAGGYEASKRWRDACKEYLLLCSACDNITGGEDYSDRAEESMGLFCERLFASFNNEPSSDGGALQATSEVVRAALGAVTPDISPLDQQVWERRLQKWENRLTDRNHTADILPPFGYDAEERTPLILASIAGQATIVSQLLERKDRLQTSDKYGRTAMHYAAMKGYTPILHTLLRHTQSIDEINIKDNDRKTPAELAMDNGFGAALALLIFYGADFNPSGGDYSRTLLKAALGGHVALVRLLLDRDCRTNVNASGGYYDTALRAAASEGHEATVRLLLDRGTDINAFGRCGNALQVAAHGGREATVRLLLDRGANINAPGGRYGNALQAAAHGAHQATVRLLLDRGADINAPSAYYSNTTQEASNGGYEGMARLPLDRSADANAPGAYYGNTLQAAPAEGHEDAFWLSLDHSADVNAPDGYYGNALQAAAHRGNEAIVRLLLDRGADVNEYSGALQVAADGGHEATVRLLLAHGANPYVSGGHYSGGNALYVAAHRGHEATIQLLLDRGIDPNAPGGHYGNALQAAVAGGHEGAIRLLLDGSADVNASGGYYGNALQAAAHRGNEAIVRLLLDRGADVQDYRDVLQAAADGGHEATFRLLFDRGKAANALNIDLGNALQAAAHRGHVPTVKLLLDHGIDVNTLGGHYGSALQAAAAEGHEATVQLLLDNGADANALGGRYGSALLAAIARGHEGSMIRLLVDGGADVNAPGNALQAAAVWGHVDTVQLLLDHGAIIDAPGGLYRNALQAARHGRNEPTIQLLTQLTQSL